MSMFTNFDSHFGQGASTGTDMTGNHTGIQQETVVGHTPGSTEMGVPHDPIVVTHMSDGMGGENTYYDGNFVHHNHPNVFGGEDVYDHNGHLLRTSIPDGLGSEGQINFASHDGSHLQSMVGMDGSPMFMDHSNAQQILSYDDPLQHAGNYVAPPFHPVYTGKGSV